MVVNVVTLNKLNEQHTQIESQRVSIIKTKTELKTTSESLKLVEGEKTTIDASLKQERKKAHGLEQENQSLKVNLQAKKEREAQAAQLASVQGTQVAQAQKPAPTVQVSGDKQSWLAASGIQQSEWGYVDSIVTRESGWNPNAVNASSGACGLGQQLPCGKWAGAWNDPVAALRAMNGYVHGRYGGWAQAVGFWQANSWY